MSGPEPTAAAPPGGPPAVGALRLPRAPLQRRRDARGALIKAHPDAVLGEVYVVELLPGQPRGEHLHRRSGEWFAPLQGACWLLARCPETGAEALIKLVDERVYVAAGIGHALWAADGAPALVLAAADRAHPDEGTEPMPLLHGRSWPDLSEQP